MKNQKLEHLWSILCTNSSVDQNTNNVSLFSIIEEVVFATDGPLKSEAIIPFSCDLVTLWKKSNEGDQVDTEGLVEVMDPKGNATGTFKYLIDIKKEHKRLRSILKIKGFKVTVPGNYIFRVKYRSDDKSDFILAGEIPLYVQLEKNFKTTNKA